MRLRRFLQYWLPVGLWMTMIFLASTGTMSGQNTSRLLAPLLRWLVPDLSPEALWTFVFVIRKAAHLTEYAILAILLWRAFRQPQPGDARPWSWREAGLVLTLCALYAASDEIHQGFVASRTGSVWDVLLDTAGAGFGLLVRWRVFWWRQRWSRRP